MPLLMDKTFHKKEFLTGIGQRLRNVREQEDYSVEEMSRLLDTTERHYRGVENGDYFLNAYRLYILKRVLGIDLDWLFFGDEKEPEDNIIYLDAGGGRKTM